MKKLFIIAAGMTILAACSRREWIMDPYSGEDGTHTVELSFGFSLPGTRGEMFSAEGESAVNDVDIVAYRTDTGQQAAHFHFDTPDGNPGSCSVSLAANVRYAFYALANFGGVDDLPLNMADLENYTYDFGSTAGVFGHGLPMASTSPVVETVVSAGQTVDMTLERLVSRIDVGFGISDAQFADSNPSSILEVKLRQSPFVCAPFNPWFVPGPAQVGDGDYAGEGCALLDAYRNSAGGFPGGRVSFYSLANNHGRLDVKDGVKYPADSDEAASCTYVEVKYSQDDADADMGYPYRGVVYYRFYAGADNEDDFSLLPNSVYSLTLDFWSSDDGYCGIGGSWTASDYRYSLPGGKFYLAQKRRLISLATPQDDVVWSLEASADGTPVCSGPVIGIDGDSEGCTVSALGCGRGYVYMISRSFGAVVCRIPVDVSEPVLVVDDCSPDLNGREETLGCRYCGTEGEPLVFDDDLYATLLRPVFGVASGPLEEAISVEGGSIVVEHPLACIPMVGQRIASAVRASAPCGITGYGAVIPANAMLENAGSQLRFAMHDYSYISGTGAEASFGVGQYDLAEGGSLEVTATSANPEWPNGALSLEWDGGAGEVHATLSSDTSLAHPAGLLSINAMVTNPHSGEVFSTKIGEGEVYVHAALAARRNMRVSTSVRNYATIHLSGYEYTVDVTPCLLGEQHPLAAEFMERNFDESGEWPAGEGEGLFSVPDELSWRDVSDYVDGAFRAVLVERSVRSRYFSSPTYTETFVYPNRTAGLSTLYSGSTYSIIGAFDPALALHFNDGGTRADSKVYRKYLLISLYRDTNPGSGGWL